jgi:hypothetical protein
MNALLRSLLSTLVADEFDDTRWDEFMVVETVLKSQLRVNKWFN